MPNTLSCTVMRDLFGTAAMREVFSSRRLVQAWLDAEVALARAQARVGVIPAAAARRIAAEADASRFDLDDLRDGIADSQHPLVPLIRELVARCGEHGGFVHWGATTQDIMDTGMVLQARDGLGLLVSDVQRACAAAQRLAQTHASTPIAGRTHGQHAVPVTFGFKAASWLDELARCRTRLERARDELLVAQLGGAAGTLASLGDDGEAVAAALADELGLRRPTATWHASRDRLRDLAHALDEVGAVGERIAAEVIRLQSTEVAEALEPAMAGHVGSSTMPQKRNPMTCEYLVASARALRGSVSTLAGAAAHAGERDMGPWALEWLAVPQAFILAASVADKLAWVLEGLTVDSAQMARNLELSNGAIMAESAMMALGRLLGHEPAHDLVMRAAKRAGSEARPLLDVLLEDRPDGVSVEALQAALRPDAYVDVAARAAHAAIQRS